MADFFVVPLRPEVSQQLSVVLGSQSCVIKIYQKETDVPVAPPGSISTDPPVYDDTEFMLLDLYVGHSAGGGPGNLVVGGVICEHANPIVRNTYFGFFGDLIVFDTQGTDDPQPSGLGTRWVLTYWPNLA